MVKSQPSPKLPKKQIFTSWLKIKQPEEDPKVRLLGEALKLSVNYTFLLIRNMEEITHCSLEKSKGAKDHMPKQ